MLEVDEVPVVIVNAHICVASPCFLNFLGSNDILRLEFDPLLALNETAPGPLNLDSRDMIHGKAMILEETTSERHLVGCLNDCCAVVSQALVLIKVSHVELGCEELLAQSLQRRVVHLGRVV